MRETCREPERARVGWLDAMKFIGIYEIYLGHFGTNAGLAYPFVFSHHVALFFFVAGCGECFNKEKSIWKYTKKRFLNLLLPFYVFGMLSIILQVILDNYGLENVRMYLAQLLRGGVRNHFFAGSLWFLSCLFVANIVFQIIKKLKNKLFIVIVSILLLYLTERVMVPKPIVYPSWIYNVDSMMCYMIYYAIGYTSFDAINSLLTFDAGWKKAVICSTAIVSFIYTGFCFFGIDKLAFLMWKPIVSVFYPVIKALIILWFWVIVSFLLRNSSFCKKIGRETLYLCGGEYLIKTLVPYVFEIVGVNIIIRRPLSVYIYSFALICLCDKFLVPILRQIVETAKRLFTVRFEN